MAMSVAGKPVGDRTGAYDRARADDSLVDPELADARCAGALFEVRRARDLAPDSPFGGIGHSGHGSEDGPEGLDACLVTKAIHQG